MENASKIKAVCDIDFLQASVCASLASREREALEFAYAGRRALVVGFLKNDEVLFVTVYRIGGPTLIIEHVFGNWGRYYRELDAVSGMLAGICGAREVMLSTDRNSSRRLAERAGYKPAEVEFIFVKKVGV